MIAADKRLNLGVKAFEYLFEPVLQAKKGLFYHYDLLVADGGKPTKIVEVP